MPISKRILFSVGLVLTIIGCFLPWRIEGDFLYFWTYGIRIFPAFEDNGGLLILLVSLILAILIYRPPIYVSNPMRWIIALSVILTFDSALQFIIWLFTLSKNWGIVGMPMIQVGLIMVLLGSITILITSVLNN